MRTPSHRSIIHDDHRLIPKAKIQMIDSISGHAAGLGRDPKDYRQINQPIADFLSSTN